MVLQEDLGVDFELVGRYSPITQVIDLDVECAQICHLVHSNSNVAATRIDDITFVAHCLDGELTAGSEAARCTHIFEGQAKRSSTLVIVALRELE